jgi:hypothetical protein
MCDQLPLFQRSLFGHDRHWSSVTFRKTGAARIPARSASVAMLTPYTGRLPPVRFLSMVAVGLVLTLAACVPGAPAPVVTAEPLSETVVGRVVLAKYATVRAAATMPNGSGATSLEGGVQIGRSGIRADLSGLFDNTPTRVIVIDNDVYLRPGSGGWTQLKLDAYWPFNTTRTAFLALLIQVLHYPADGKLLAGLAYIDGPAEEIDGATVRASVVTVDNKRFRDSMSTAQVRRLDDALDSFSGLRLQLSLDDVQLPRRLIASLVGSFATVDIAIRDWGRAVTITEPPATDVVPA